MTLHAFVHVADISVNACRCGKWPLHHVHTGDRGACTCDVCTAAVAAARTLNVPASAIDTPEVIASVILEAAAPHITAAAAAAERQRIRQLALDVGATHFYASQTGVPATSRPFAELLEDTP